MGLSLAAGVFSRAPLLVPLLSQVRLHPTPNGNAPFVRTSRALAITMILLGMKPEGLDTNLFGE
jgi:hypothetical protein